MSRTSHVTPHGMVQALTGWPFWTAVVLLGGAALIQWPLAARLGVIADKAPAPPRLALSATSRDPMSPYRFVRAETLSAETVEALGTREYLVWVMENPARGTADPLRVATLVVTYYTGGPDLAVHRPEECYSASGMAPQERKEVVRKINSLPPELRDVPLRALTFRSRGLMSGGAIDVIYTFFCNGRFTTSPNDIRLWTHAPGRRSAYFSKVEISFSGRNEPGNAAGDVGGTGGARGAGQAAHLGDRLTLEDTMDGAAELLESLLPRLVHDVWPSQQQLEEVESDSAP